MFRKLLTALFLACTLVAVAACVPGLLENVAAACDPSDPTCD